MSTGKLTPDIDSINLYREKPILLHGYIWPFVLLYSIWLGYWFGTLGATEYVELGLIGVAVISVLHVLTALFCYWFVSVRCLLMFRKEKLVSQATFAKVIPPANSGYPAIVPIFHTKSIATERLTHYFFYQRLKYTFDSDDKESIHAVRFPLSWSLREYKDWRGYTSEEGIKIAKENYGDNHLRLSVPPFMELFLERATAPFFVFQVFSVFLWCLDEYWLYPIMTLVLLVLFESGLVMQQLKNLKEIRSMGAQPYRIHVYRNRKWNTISSEDIVAGDIVSVTQSVQEKLIPCDLLLLRGTCIVDESMLTGESIPVTKEPVESLTNMKPIDFGEDDKMHVLFGGTKIVQMTPPAKYAGLPKAPDNGCLCFVLRTGLSTCQGRLLKTIMFSVKAITANNLETLAFIAFLLVFAITASAYVWIVGTADPRRNRYKLFLECTLIITSVIPQELPIELSLAVNTSLASLSKMLIYCTEPFRIPLAGRVDICCFDKTGTLTEDEVVVEGVTGLNGELAEKIIPVRKCPLPTIQVLASAHALVHSESGLLGDPLEKAMLKAVGWSLNAEGVVHGKTTPRSPPLRIYQRFRFTSQLRRMSTVVGYQGTTDVDLTYMACVKGSPEVLKSMFVDLPMDYDDAYLQMARRGARVLALGHKTLGRLSHQQVRELEREEVESNLTFAGFVVISCPLKPDSLKVIQMLKSSSHHVTMVTGDNPLTACHVSDLLGITRKDMPILVFTPPNELDDSWHWQSVDDKVVVPCGTVTTTRELARKYEFCLTGDGIEELRRISSSSSGSCESLLNCMLPKAKVLSRVAPSQKEFVLASLRELGYTTLMCGDGTNDVGALKQAHVGVALLNQTPIMTPAKNGVKSAYQLPLSVTQPQSGRHRQPFGNSKTLQDLAADDEVPIVRLGDASIAAPFTAKMSSAIGVCHIIRQGRCTLVTTLQMFKILAINCLISAYSLSVLFLKGFKISDCQTTIQALLMTGCFLFISRSKPLEKLSPRRPLPNVFNLYTLLTVGGQFAVHFAALYSLMNAAEAQMPPLPEGELIDIYADFKPTVLNTAVYLISTALQISTIAVNYEGHPFRESLFENRPLLNGLLFATAGVVALAFGAFSDSLELVLLDDSMRLAFFQAMIFDFVAAWMVDRLLFLLLGRVRVKKL
ncbi:Manganese-transporting ATPase 13A1 [Echinococcus granulosus]|nr:Manganese-transporting ATPase 13A1 [Echinococcus granulosus]